MSEESIEVNVYLFRQHKKKDIALEFLGTACDCYNHGKYFSALHLAGASEEILGKYLKSLDIDHALKSEIEAFKSFRQEIYGKETSDKYAWDFLNRAKNSAKHMSDLSDEILESDSKKESEEVLVRAFTNLCRMGEDLAPYQKVWDEIEGRG